MVKFNATISQFARQGEKTGWTYIEIPTDIAEALKPGNRKSFRVKGRLDSYAIHAVALLPMGGGRFILPFNAVMRKGTGKKKGAMVQVQLAADDKPQVLNPELLECLADDPPALQFFNSIPGSYRKYFSKWVESAKTDATRTRRIAQAVSALSRQMNFPEMMRSLKD